MAFKTKGLYGPAVTDVSGNIVFATGTTTPVASAKGFAKYCLFINTAASTEATAWYINTGTASAAIWTADDLNVAEMALLSGLLATAAEINRVAKPSTRVVAIGPSDSATLAITEALHDGKTIYVTKTDGWNATLPTPVPGMKFRIIIGATIATASTIKSAAGTHLMIGHALLGNNSDNSVVDWPATAASTFDTIDLLGTSNSTGGMEGQEITIEAMSTTRWFVSIRGDASGTEAAPWGDTVT